MAVQSISSGRGNLSVVQVGRGLHILRPDAERLERLRKHLVRDDSAGHFSPTRERVLLENTPEGVTPFQQRTLAWLRDHVNRGIPRAWYKLVLGHDLHVSTYATLHLKHWHALEPDPFNPDVLGWLENVGLVSMGKVTTAFVAAETAAMGVATDTGALLVYNDFIYHEVGLSNQAEANTDTQLINTTGIARQAGDRTATTTTFRTIATITADTNGETWQEHGVFDASSGGTLLDRSLISPTVPVNSPDTVQFTYTLTKSPEA